MNISMNSICLLTQKVHAWGLTICIPWIQGERMEHGMVLEKVKRKVTFPVLFSMDLRHAEFSLSVPT